MLTMTIKRRHCLTTKKAFVILCISAQTQYWPRSFVVACKCQYQTDHPLSLLQHKPSTLYVSRKLLPSTTSKIWGSCSYSHAILFPHQLYKIWTWNTNIKPPWRFFFSLMRRDSFPICFAVVGKMFLWEGTVNVRLAKFMSNAHKTKYP